MKVFKFISEDYEKKFKAKFSTLGYKFVLGTNTKVDNIA